MLCGHVMVRVRVRMTCDGSFTYRTNNASYIFYFLLRGYYHTLHNYNSIFTATQSTSLHFFFEIFVPLIPYINKLYSHLTVAVSYAQVVFPLYFKHTPGCS